MKQFGKKIHKLTDLNGVSKTTPSNNDVLKYNSATGDYEPSAIGEKSFTSVTDPAINAAVTTAIIDAYDGVVITLTAAGNAQTLQTPTDTTAGKEFIVNNKSTSTDPIVVNSISLAVGESQKFLWDGSAWSSMVGVDATQIDFTPYSTISGTNVQLAMQEIIDEKQEIIWSDDATNVTPANAGRHVDIGTGLLKDNDVTAGIALGDGSNTALSGFSSTSIVGALNELNFGAVQAYYVGKHGSDSNTGKNEAEALLTIGAAITKAIADTPAEDNRIVIYVTDAGTYTESLAIPSWVGIIGVAAKITGNHTIADNSLLQSFRLTSATGICVTKSAGTGSATVVCPRMILTGTSSGVVCSSGSINYRGEKIEVENGLGFADTSTGIVSFNITSIIITGTGYGISLVAAGTVSGMAEEIYDTGTGTGILVTAGGTVNLTSARISCNTAYNVASGCTLNLFCPSLTGTKTNAGTVNYISANNGMVQNGGAVFNEAGDDVDFRIESDTNTNAFFLDGTNGSIGFGTSTPAVIQHIASTGAVLPRVESSDGLGDAGFRFYSGATYKGQIGWDQGTDTMGLFSSGNSATPSLAVSSAGNLGVGTTTPTAKLDVNGEVLVQGRLQLASATPDILFSVPSGGLDSRIYNDGSGNLIFGNGTNSATPTERMTINSAGNVGVGTTTPSTKLDVYNVTAFTENITSTFGSAIIRGVDRTLTNTTKGILDLEMSGESGGQNKGATLTFSNNKWQFGSSYTEVFGGIKVSNELATNQSSNGYMAFSVNNGTSLAERMRITSAGNIGIGTTTPSQKLTLSGTTALSTALGLYNTFNHADNRNWAILTNSGGYGDFLIMQSNAQNGDPIFSGTSRFVIGKTGNVGIGTTTPTSKLVVRDGNLFITGSTHSGDFSTFNNGIGLAEGVTAGNFGAFITGVTTGSWGGNIQFVTRVDAGGTGTERMRITSAGNVGIGTTAPASKLHMFDANTSIHLNEVNTGGTGVASWRLKHGLSYYGAYVGTTNNLIFYDYGNSREIMRFDSSGNVGIGNTAPSVKLSLLGVGGSTALQQITTAVAGTTPLDGFVFGMANDTDVVFTNYETGVMRFHTAGTERLRITSTGDVGIGTTTPLSLLHMKSVSNDITFRIETDKVDGQSQIRIENDATYWQLITDSNDNFLIGNADSTFPFSIQNGTPTNSFKILSSGNVGVGTATPATKIHASSAGETWISADTTASASDRGFKFLALGVDRAKIGFNNSTAITTFDNLYGGISIKTGTAGTSTEAIRILSNQNVGFGIAAPTSKIHAYLNDTAVAPMLTIEQDGTGDASMQFLLTGDQAWSMGVDNSNANSFNIGTSGSDVGSLPKVTILTSGNVGLGTNNPASLLELSSATPTMRLTDTDDSTYATIVYNVGALQLNADAGNTGASSTIRFLVDNSEKVRIDANGNLGVGINSPVSIGHFYQNTTDVSTGAGLTIEQAGTGDALIQFLLSGAQRWVAGIDNSDSDKFKIASSTDLASDARITVTATGLTGVGTTSPIETLHVDGGFRHSKSFIAGESLVAGDLCYLKSDGKMWKADADAETTTKGLLGIALGVASAEASVSFMLRGTLITGGLTTGSELYISPTAGTWTATKPSVGGQQVRIIGYALSTTELFFNPDNIYIGV